MSMKQEEKVLKYMEQFGSITQLEALNDLGIMRLAPKIFNLRKDGILIIKETVPVKNRYGDTVYVARYSLDKGEER